MNRRIWFTICVLLGLLMLLCGWLIPAHLRAIEPLVLKRAGHGTSSLAGRGVSLDHIGQLGAAEILLRDAENANLPDTNDLASAIATTLKKSPGTEAWGVNGPAARQYFPKPPKVSGSNQPSFTDFVVLEENRKKALDVLAKSKEPSVQALLQTRALTNTTTFAPSQSAAGAAFDTAVIITGLLENEHKLTPALSSEIETAASQANQGGSPEALEQILLDVLSLGQRFNWGQLATFVSKTDSAATLHSQADLIRNHVDQLPELFSAVELSADPQAVAQYLKTFPQSGMKDLIASLSFGAGSVRELLHSQHRIYTSASHQTASQYEPFASFIDFSADYSARMPELALMVKWLLYFCGGVILAVAFHVRRPAVSALEAPLQVRGFHIAREILFGLGFLLVVLLLSEPFLAQEGATTAMPFRLHLPTVGDVVPPGTANLKTSIMDKSKLIPMLLFFTLQGLLYTACLVKLAEIRRQRVGPRVKLRLLENEEHLFDGGLYLGFLGTIVAFILSSVRAQPHFDLMVAYSSTSFGILFVSLFKIFNLRPVRRQLLLEAEAESPVAPATAATPAPSLASP